MDHSLSTSRRKWARPDNHTQNAPPERVAAQPAEGGFSENRDRTSQQPRNATMGKVTGIAFKGDRSLVVY
jgi:hypothetical protein